MANKRTVILRGDYWVQNEDGAATAVIKPGYLVDGVTSVAPHASAGGACPLAIALEREEFGAGIDTNTTANPYTGIGASATDYAIGDTVKLAVLHAGHRFVGWIASGQNIAANDRMESAGDGSFRKFASGVILARALETLSVTALTKIQLEVM